MTKTESQKLRAAFQNMKKQQPKKKAGKANQPAQSKQKMGGIPNQIAPRSVGAAKGTVISKKLEVVEAKRNKKFPGSICIRGQELLQSVNGSGASVGTNVVTQFVNPVHFVGTRLAQYGKLYDKYLFTKMRVTFASGMSTGTDGQYILAYDRDFADATPAATVEGLQQYYSMMNSKIANSWESISIDCNLADFQDFYYNNDTGYEGRIVYQGQIYMAAVSGSTFTGAIMLDYECEFYDPQLETPDTTFVARKSSTQIIDDGTSLYRGLDVVYGPSSSTESTKPWLWVDGGGEEYVSVPPGDWVIDFAAYLLNNTNDDPTGLTQTVYRLNKDSIKDLIVDEVVNSLIRIDVALNTSISPTLSSAGALMYRVFFSIPPDVGRVAILTTLTFAFTMFNRQLTVIPVSSGRLAIGDAIRSSSSDGRRSRPVKTPTLSQTKSVDSSAKPKDEAVKINQNDAPDFIDPGQLELYKQFVRMQIPAKVV